LIINVPNDHEISAIELLGKQIIPVVADFPAA
jgi:hypothetical protein